MKEYNKEEVAGFTIIWYEENGIRISFGEDPANSDYQEYLKSINN